MWEDIQLLTYGTVGINLLFPMLKLTGTKTLDKRHHRLNCQSFNPTGNQFTIGRRYCATTHLNTQRMMRLDNKLFFNASEDNHNPMTCPVMRTWVWDKRFEYLLNKKLLTSRLYTTHYCEVKGIDFVDYKNNNLWGKVDLKNHFEVILKHKKYTPIEDVDIFGKDILKFTNSFEQIRSLFNIDKHTRVIIYSKTKLMKNDKKSNSYISTKPSRSDLILKDLVCRILRDKKMNVMV